jgi:hypothetical protein
MNAGERALREALAALNTERDRYAADLARLATFLREATRLAGEGKRSEAVVALSAACSHEYDLMLCTEISERVINALGLARDHEAFEEARAACGAL